MRNWVMSRMLWKGLSSASKNTLRSIQYHHKNCPTEELSFVGIYDISSYWFWHCIGNLYICNTWYIQIKAPPAIQTKISTTSY
jgi:hypothetical protein